MVGVERIGRVLGWSNENWRRPITHPRRLLRRLRCKVLLNGRPPTPTPSRSAALDEKSRVIDDRGLVFRDRSGWGELSRNFAPFSRGRERSPDSRGKVKWIVVLFVIVRRGAIRVSFGVDLCAIYGSRISYRELLDAAWMCLINC